MKKNMVICRLTFSWWRWSSVELTKRCVVSFINSVSLIRKVLCYQTSNCPAWAWRRRTSGPYNTASPSHTPAPDYRKSAHPLRPRLAETSLPSGFPSTRLIIPLSNNFPHVKPLLHVDTLYEEIKSCYLILYGGNKCNEVERWIKLLVP